MKIGIFGGSFNPIHFGHIGVALKAARDYALDKVLVVPAGRNPFKETSGPDALRWTLVRYACEPYPVLVPCDIELRRGGVSYAIDTVREIAAKYPKAELFFIIGEDSVAGLPKWKDADELRRLVTFISFPRTVESSSEIRNLLAAGQPISHLVPEAVDCFLSSKGVVFDFGGVISISPRNDSWPLYPYCAKLGLSRAKLDEGWHKFRAMWDGGDCSFAEMYRLTFADAGLPPPTPSQLEELWNIDAGGWVQTLSPHTLALMKDLKSLGKKIGILSNMSEDFHRLLFVSACAEYRALADVEVISGIERMVKPEKCIYDLAASRLGLPPSSLLFLDDTESNVIAARSFGWHSLVYKAQA